MSKDYPKNITWMIEVRDWPDNEDPVSTQEHPGVPAWMKYAPEQVTSFGTGVVIRLEQLTSEDKPMNPPQIKNYLLTCGHVVRVGEAGWGRVGKEIVCWHPGYGYQQTKHAKPTENIGRLKGVMEGGHGAKVSTLSPYDGRLEAIPEQERKKQHDWVLLEVTDVDDRDPFDSEPRVRAVHRPVQHIKTVTFGYPDGAGWEKRGEGNYTGKHQLKNGKVPQAKSSEQHTIETVENEIITYHGVVHTRAGMSGGGSFREPDLSLVGLHRSRDDSALEAEAICLVDILEWLRTQRHIRPVFQSMDDQGKDAGTGGWHKWWKWAVAGAGIALASAAGLYFFSSHHKLESPSNTYHWKGIVVEDVNGQERPVEGVSVKVSASNVVYHSLNDITDNNGHYEITTDKPQFTTGDIQLRISKTGYELISDPHRHAVEDETYCPVLTIKKVINP